MAKCGEEETLDAGKRFLARVSALFRSLPVIFQQKRQFSTVFSGAVRKYRFIDSLNESLTRRSITCSSRMNNERNVIIKHLTITESYNIF